MLIRVAWKSLLNRKLTMMLTVFSIAVSVFVLIGVLHLKQEVKQSFTKTVSGVDLIVGARTGQINLLLYSVFHVGNATNNISWESYQALMADPKVAWTIPISLGDSHKGYRVIGTTPDYFVHFAYGDKHKLEFAEGEPFSGVYDVVLGAEVAKKLDYQLHDEIILSHGVGNVSFSKHDDKPFTVVGILKPTGTPVDQSVHVSLAGIEAIHVDWQNGAKIPGRKIPAEVALQYDLTPKSITAIMVGLKSKVATFAFQRTVNEYRQEPLLAVLPGVALAELWQMMRMVENLLTFISILVMIAALLGMSTMLLASMKERQRELAVLRSIGAHPSFIFFIVQLEAVFITTMGILVGLSILFLFLAVSQNYLIENYGLFIGMNIFSPIVFKSVAIIFVAAALIALLPSILIYRSSLSSGLVIRN